MGTVMIRCPRTDRAVSTQIDTEASVFERLPEVASRLRCPACGEEHVWTAGTHGCPTCAGRPAGPEPGPCATASPPHGR